MKNEQLILVAAVGFAAFLVAQKTGLFKRAALTGGPYPSATFHNDSAFAESSEEKGYDPDNPGAYVFTDDLIKGVADNDWGYTPSRFEQTADSLLYAPNYYRAQ
jgi:hypothetical protein